MKKKFFKTLKKITYLFIFIFGCAGSPLLRVESEGCSSLQRRGPGASREQALSVQASAGVSLEHRLTGLAAGTWDLPGPGIEPMSLALAARFFTSQSPRKPKKTILNMVLISKNLFFKI